MGGDWNSLTHSLPEIVNLHEAEATLDDLEQAERDHKAYPDEYDAPDEEQLVSLRALKEAMSGDWDSTAQGVALISESYWEDYAQETASDIGMVDEDSAIYAYIDWSKWADAMQQDYTECTVEEGIFEGTWWYRV